MVRLSKVSLPLGAERGGAAATPADADAALRAALAELGAARSFAELPPLLRAAPGFQETWHTLAGFDAVVLGN